MELAHIMEGIGEGNIVTDIYSGDIKCKCGKGINFLDLSFGEFGNSLTCSCGHQFWFAAEEDEVDELLVYEGYDYAQEEGFVIVKQRVYGAIDWKRKKLIKDKLRQDNDYLYIDLDSNVFVCFDSYGKGIVNGAKEFFRNINIEAMEDIAKYLEEYCSINKVYPNYGSILKELNNFYNTASYELVIKNVIARPYLELFIKNGLGYLFENNFLVNVDMLEKSIRIDRNAQSSSKMLRLPKKVIPYIRENKLDEYKILLLQNFFIESNFMDFKNLVANTDSMFQLQHLGRLRYLLRNGYTSSNLNIYAREIMEQEGLDQQDFLNYLADSVRMSKTGDLEFKLYGKRLKQRHDELAAKYKLVKDDAIKGRLEDIHNNASIKQYGDKYVAVVPEAVQDFEEEASNQKNCVLSYAETMAYGETLIVFVRYKEEQDKSYITLEIKDRKIVQAKKFANRSIDQEDRRYLEGLARINGWIM
jgi:hypothetical protein